jgi:murein L,D-transpeptidase YafK
VTVLFIYNARLDQASCVNETLSSNVLDRWTGDIQTEGQGRLKLKHALIFLVQAIALGFGALALTGCAGLEPERVVKTGTVQPATLRLMASLGMERGAPILIRVYKQESVLEVWKLANNGRFALLKSYPICRFSGALGPKKVEGDYQAPEGFYTIAPDQMNPFSHEYLAFNIGFPNAFDQSLGRTGSFVMVHGGCRSVGCYAMTDALMDEIYGLAYEAFQAGQDQIQLQAFPFRMTAQNLIKHSDDPNAPFWAMLKRGSDAFEASHLPPSVAVCGQQYVFNTGLSAKDADPLAACPPGLAPAAMAFNGQTEQAASSPPRPMQPPPPPANKNPDLVTSPVDETSRLPH